VIIITNKDAIFRNLSCNHHVVPQTQFSPSAVHFPSNFLVTCFFFQSQRSFVRIYDAKTVYGGDGILLSNYRLCRSGLCLETLIVSADSDGSQFHLEIVFSCPSGQCCSCPCYCRSVGCFSISRVFTVLSSLPGRLQQHFQVTNSGRSVCLAASAGLQLYTFACLCCIYQLV
jgi:hypothetical protein